jgi:uncharacterized protein (DUF302 family)
MRQPIPASFIPPVVIPHRVLLSDASSENLPGTAGGRENHPGPGAGSVSQQSFGTATLISSGYQIGSFRAFPMNGPRMRRCVALAMMWALPAEEFMFARAFLIGALMASASTFAAAASPDAEDNPAARSDGAVADRSAYPMAETIERLKQDIASKGLSFFVAIEQSKLAGDAGVKLHPSTLLIFGNPALGAQFITSNPVAGLDWPVRLLVFQDESGAVWTAYTDFQWIAHRHQIKDRGAAFGKASEVIASITSSVKAR